MNFWSFVLVVVALAVVFKLLQYVAIGIVVGIAIACIGIFVVKRLS